MVEPISKKNKEGGSMSMYGKKRIVIQKNNQIVLAGGGSWFPVGFIKILGDSIRAIIVKPEFIFRYPRDENNFDEIYFSSKKALKELVNKRYNWIKEAA